MSLHIHKQLVLYLETHKFNKPNRLTSQRGLSESELQFVRAIYLAYLSDSPKRCPNKSPIEIHLMPT